MGRIALTFLFWGFVACTPGGNSDSAGGPDSSDSGPEPTVTWYADIEPMLAQNCAACHDADRIGGVDLSTYETASQYADLMVAWVATGWMPLPAADPSCRDYHGSDRKWMDAEAKEKLYTCSVLRRPSRLQRVFFRSESSSRPAGARFWEGGGEVGLS